MTAFFIDPTIPLKHPSIIPKERGLYVRDWRGTSITPESERILSLDWWEPVPGDPLIGPGLWFVWPGWNDASVDRLPWREATEIERDVFFKQNPGAREIELEPGADA